MNRPNRLGELAPLTLDQYHRMVAAGVIGEDEPLELLEGVLVAKDQGKGPGMGHGPKHATSVTHLYDWLKARLGPRWVVRCQLPITLNSADASEAGLEPEPDVTVADGPNSRYADHHPNPKEIRLIVEAGDTSLANDRLFKGPLYARANVPCYWIINLVDHQLEVYTDPDPDHGAYRSRQVLGEDQQVTLAWEGLAAITVTVRELFP
jgi:hypothetical protein